MPILWDKTHNEYKKHELRNRAWEKLGLILAVTGDEAKDKWNYLRENFGAKLKKLPSGSGASESGKWRYFDAMLFIKDVVKPRKSESNADIESIQKTKIVGIDIDNGTFLSEVDLDDSALDGTTWRPESSSSAAKSDISVDKTVSRQHQSLSDTPKNPSKRKNDDSSKEINALIVERLKRPIVLETEDSHFGSKICCRKFGALAKVDKVEDMYQDYGNSIYYSPIPIDYCPIIPFIIDKILRHSIQFRTRVYQEQRLAEYAHEFPVPNDI
uniref:MADF domain-containing protein n=1 Tax=Romanomermis culicivorax TaxID=13658 RepID=A0A915KGL8_ROMCU